MNVDEFMEQFKPLSIRFDTMKRALQLLHEKNGTFMVETGTTRMKDDWGAGMSTLVFGAYCKQFGGQLTTVDINPQNMDISKEVTKEYKDYIHYVISDSVFYLKLCNTPIDFLYLDSVDCPIECGPDDKELLFAQNHQLEEIKTAMPKLNEEAIVLLDDNDFAHGGKTRLTKKYLECEGWDEITSGKQSLWIR
jgi:hypothetical protein